MAPLTRAGARTAIDVADAAEIARMAGPRDPDLLAREEMAALLGHSALVLDGLRRRPRYFDGRFLTGADLARDQDYIRQRQADLARASGSGVVAGLEVSLADSAGGETIVIAPGHGVTPSGAIVGVTTRREIALLDLATVDRLDATLGLSVAPRAPLGRRSGVFLLALRAVEFTANPIAAYPTAITGPRRVEDGDVIEASAITLIPWPDAAPASLDEARRDIARRVFLGEAEGIPQDALPLAMLALERGAVRWIDVAMVRRETGADTPLQVSLGARPRALAEAFVLQHRRHLADVLEERAAAGLPAGFAAAQYFTALPAAGQLPAAAILPDAQGFQQLWFPPAVDVEISFIPSDEIAALVEESLALPPIDLAGDPEDLDATGVVVLAPLTRQRLQRFELLLGGLSTATRADPGQGVRRAPAQMLAALLARNTRLAEARARDAAARARTESAEARLGAWQAAWAEAVAALPASDGMPPLLWYARRRALPGGDSATGAAVAFSGDDAGLQQAVEARLRALGQADRLGTIAAAATPFALARALAFLGAPRIAASTVLSAAALRDLEAALPRAAAPAGSGTTGTASPSLPPARLGARPGFGRLVTARAAGAAATRLSEADVIAIAADYGDPRLGDGLARVAQALSADPLPQAGEIWLGGSGVALDIDRAARDLPDENLAGFATGLRQAARDQSAEALQLLLAGTG